MDHDVQRKRMVDEQLVPRGISSPGVLEAFMRVPRHLFVPEAFGMEAYADHPLPIGEGQTISQPYIVALMTECLGLKGGERVLEIGTGSGYQAAILAEICGRVYTVEREKVLSERAAKALAEQGYGNISYKTGDGTLGWEEEAPFDGVIVTAAAPDVPEPLKTQLAEGGRLVIPVGDRFSQTLVVVRKTSRGYEIDRICGCVFVPLVGEHGWPAA